LTDRTLKDILPSVPKQLPAGPHAPPSSGDYELPDGIAQDDIFNLL